MKPERQICHMTVTFCVFVTCPGGATCTALYGVFNGHVPWLRLLVRVLFAEMAETLLAA